MSSKIILDSEGGFGIVLSGGGTHGAYEAGVIKALNESGIKFKLAAGTSVGALNASLISAGKIDRIVELWENISPKKVLSFSPKIFSQGALLNNFPLEKLMRAEIDKKATQNIINASTKLIVISCDLRNKKEIVDKDFKNYEQIIHSIMSSCAIPLVFPSHKMSEKLKEKELENLLIDGGFVNNFPLKVAIESGLCKTFFTTSLNVPEVEISEDKKSNRQNLFQTGMRVLEIVFTAAYLNEINEIKEKIKLANDLKDILETRSIPSNILSRKRTKKIKKLYEEYKIYEGVNIVEINPKKKLPIGVLEFSADKAKKAIERGYEDAKEELKNIEIV